MQDDSPGDPHLESFGMNMSSIQSMILLASFNSKSFITSSPIYVRAAIFVPDSFCHDPER